MTFDTSALSNEAARLDALAQSGLMDSARDARFDRITRLISHALGVPVALVSLVDLQRQFFKSEHGLPAPWSTCRQTPLSHSFCQHVVTRGTALRISDARTDPLVADNLAVKDLNVIAYLGVPLRSSGGYVLGSLCAIDSVPRDWTDAQYAMLQDFAGIVEDQINLVHNERRWREILDTMPQMVWSTLPDGFHDFYNARWYEFTGVPAGSTDGEAWNDMFHPDDQERARTRWRHSLATGEPYEIEYRLRHRSGVYHWTLGRALPIRDARGRIERWFGTCTDIHALKEAEAQRDLIAGELAHRIQNIFAVVTGLISASARGAPEAKAFADTLTARIRALAQAHRYVKTGRLGLSDSIHVRDADRTLSGLARSILAPYAMGESGANITIAGDDSAIDERAASALALILHELATNALKYGALSSAGGALTLTAKRAGDTLELTWHEAGGPPITQSPERAGFGSRLVTAMLAQLGGSVDRRWAPDGLTVHIALPASSLGAPVDTRSASRPEGAERV